VRNVTGPSEKNCETVTLSWHKAKKKIFLLHPRILWVNVWKASFLIKISLFSHFIICREIVHPLKILYYNRRNGSSMRKRIQWHCNYYIHNAPFPSSKWIWRQRWWIQRSLSVPKQYQEWLINDLIALPKACHCLNSDTYKCSLSLKSIKVSDISIWRIQDELLFIIIFKKKKKKKKKKKTPNIPCTMGNSYSIQWAFFSLITKIHFHLLVLFLNHLLHCDINNKLKSILHHI
jgi:hypothetical protein